MSSKVAFFINETSGSGKSPETAERLERALPGLRISRSLPSTSSALTEACGKLDPSETKAAVVFGGDGTQTYALRGLLETGIPLYPYPSGTANDLASEQGITGCREQMQRLIEEESIEEVRVLGVNGIPFSTVAGIGIGAELCAEYNGLRSRHSWFKKLSRKMNCEIYSLLALKNIARNWGKGFKVRMSTDEGFRELEVSALMVCNQSTLAGNLKVAPGQSKSGETFTVLIHPGPCGMDTIKGLAGLKLGRIDSSFLTFKATSLHIESLDGTELPVFGDGEILIRSKSLEFKAHPRKLRIYKA